MDGLGMKYRAIYSIIIAYLYYTLYNISLYNHICLILGVMQQKYKCNGNTVLREASTFQNKKAL